LAYHVGARAATVDFAQHAVVRVLHPNLHPRAPVAAHAAQLCGVEAVGPRLERQPNHFHPRFFVGRFFGLQGLLGPLRGRPLVESVGGVKQVPHEGLLVGVGVRGPGAP